jgi:hypothetical protein
MFYISQTQKSFYDEKKSDNVPKGFLKEEFYKQEITHIFAEYYKKNTKMGDLDQHLRYICQKIEYVSLIAD